jgi:hypothetical protein
MEQTTDAEGTMLWYTGRRGLSQMGCGSGRRSADKARGEDGNSRESSERAGSGVIRGGGLRGLVSSSNQGTGGREAAILRWPSVERWRK